MDHWRQLEARQQPSWPDAHALHEATTRLAEVPPLVFAGEADRLRELLASASRGEAFLLQGGDCAETFAELSQQLVVVTHDLDLVSDFDRVLVVDEGRVVIDDSPGPALDGYRRIALGR